MKTTIHHHVESSCCCSYSNACSRRGTEAGGQPTADDIDEFDDEETFLNLDDVLHGKHTMTIYHLKPALSSTTLWVGSHTAGLSPGFSVCAHITSAISAKQ